MCVILYNTCETGHIESSILLSLSASCCIYYTYTLQSEHNVMSLRAENDQQLDLIQSSRVALSDLRKRYDSGIVSWNEEREHLLKKIRDVSHQNISLSPSI